MYTINAINIQRVGRGHIARRGKVRDVLEANHASRVITRALRTYILNKVRESVHAAAGLLCGEVYIGCVSRKQGPTLQIVA